MAAISAISLPLNSNHLQEEHDLLTALLLCLVTIFLFLNYFIALQPKNSLCLYFYVTVDYPFPTFFVRANCSSQMYLIYFISTKICDLLYLIYRFCLSIFIIHLWNFFSTLNLFRPNLYSNHHYLLHFFKLNQIF